MIVIADTSPLNYLVQLKLEFLLEHLFSEVYLPEGVLTELLHSGSPEGSESAELDQNRFTYDSRCNAREPTWAGERQAITLAYELHATVLLVDDLLGRTVAERLGLPLSGTLGVIRDGATDGLVDFDRAVSGLQHLGFRAAADVIERSRPKP